MAPQARAANSLMAAYERHLLDEVWAKRLRLLALVELSGFVVISLAYDLPIVAHGWFGTARAGLWTVLAWRAPLVFCAGIALAGALLPSRWARAAPWFGFAPVTLYTAFADLGFYALGYQVNGMHAVAFLITVVVGQTMLPLTLRQRLASWALVGLAHFGHEVAFGSAFSPAERVLLNAGLAVCAGYAVFAAELVYRADLAAFRDRQSTDASLAALAASRQELMGASKLLVEAASDLSHAAQEMTGHTSSAQAQTQDIAAGSGELAMAANLVSANIERSAELVRAARARTLDLERSAHSADATLAAVVGAVDGSRETFARLEESASRIGEFVETIREIAEESKVLAVNASLEAARAGEQGTGFQVVAREMTGLAANSGERAASVRGVVSGVSRDLGSAAGSVQGIRASALEFSAEYQKVRAAVAGLQDGYRLLDEAIEAGARQVKEQTRAVEEISGAVSKVAHAAQESAEQARRLTATAAGLEALARRLDQSVAG